MVSDEALIRMVTGERRMLQAYIRAIIRDTHLCEDVLQDVVVVAIKQREQFANGTDLGAWLRAIARRTALAALRKAGQQAVPLAPETLDALDRSFCAQQREIWEEEREALRECLKELPEASHRLISYKYGDEFSLERIASEMARSVDAIKSTLKRLRAALAECVSARIRRAQKNARETQS